MFRKPSTSVVALVLAAVALVVARGRGSDAQEHAGGGHEAHGGAASPTNAVCVLVPTAGSDVKGVVAFTQAHGHVSVHAEITGLAPGKHGFHVHEFGDLRSHDGTSAGSHYNPTGVKHALPNGGERHVGDLGNLEADASGKAVYHRDDAVLTLHGPHSILGRGLVVHAKEDDGGQPVGNAGARVAVGVIGAAKPD